MRISDWSSDVCSSDLFSVCRPGDTQLIAIADNRKKRRPDLTAVSMESELIQEYIGREAARRIRIGRQRRDLGATRQIGSASCRDRVCQSVEISVVAVALKQKNKKNLEIAGRAK